MRAFVRLSVLFVAAATLAACSSNPPRNEPVKTYPTPAPRQSAYVEYGTVRSVEMVRGESSGTTGAGAVIGGVAGAVVGRSIGDSSRGKNVGTVVGAVGGALIGNEIEKQNRRGQDVLRVQITMDNGSGRTLDVSTDMDIRAGDRVRVENNQIYRL